MNSLKFWVAAGSVLLTSQAAAAGQDVSGIGCSSDDLTLVTGVAFNAQCMGDLRIDPASIIEAEESITLRATGMIWMLGTLVAPRIELVAEASAHVSGGLFSGSPDFYPDVNAVSYAGSLTAFSRDFNDLVPRPHIDPVFGAAVLSVGGSTALRPSVLQISTSATVGTVSFTGSNFILVPEGLPTPVPEPAYPMLFAAGLALIAWKRRSNRTMSHTAHTT